MVHPTVARSILWLGLYFWGLLACGRPVLSVTLLLQGLVWISETPKTPDIEEPPASRPQAALLRMGRRGSLGVAARSFQRLHQEITSALCIARVNLQDLGNWGHSLCTMASLSSLFVSCGIKSGLAHDFEGGRHIHSKECLLVSSMLSVEGHIPVGGCQGCALLGICASMNSVMARHLSAASLSAQLTEVLWVDKSVSPSASEELVWAWSETGEVLTCLAALGPFAGCMDLHSFTGHMRQPEQPAF